MNRLHPLFANILEKHGIVEHNVKPPMTFQESVRQELAQIAVSCNCDIDDRLLDVLAVAVTRAAHSSPWTGSSAFEMAYLEALAQ